MAGTGCDGGVGHFSDRLHIDGRVRKNQTIPRHPFCNCGNRRVSKLPHHSPTELVISFAVAHVRQQRGQAVIGIVVGRIHCDRPHVVRTCRREFSSPPMDHAQNIQNRDRGWILNLAHDPLRFVELIPADEEPRLSELAANEG